MQCLSSGKIRGKRHGIVGFLFPAFRCIVIGTDLVLVSNAVAGDFHIHFCSHRKDIFTGGYGSCIGIFLQFIHIFIIQIQIPECGRSLPLKIICEISVFRNGILIPVHIRSFVGTSIDPGAVLQTCRCRRRIVVFLFPLCTLRCFHLKGILIILCQLII